MVTSAERKKTVWRSLMLKVAPKQKRWLTLTRHGILQREAIETIEPLDPKRAKDLQGNHENSISNLQFKINLARTSTFKTMTSNGLRHVRHVLCRCTRKMPEQTRNVRQFHCNLSEYPGSTAIQCDPSSQIPKSTGSK